MHSISGDTPMRVVLFTLNSQYVHASPAPWALLEGIRAYAGKGIFGQVHEGNINEPIGQVASRLAAFSPDVLGISCYIWNISATKELLCLLRQALPACKIVLGGPEVTFNAAQTLVDVPQADFVLRGEGEWPFARLLDALGGLAPLEEVPGLCMRTPGGIHLSPPYVHPTMPAPFSQGYAQEIQGRIGYVEGSRGCPYHCAFCLSGREETMRFHPPAQAIADALRLAQAGARTVKFVDRTFNARRIWARDILKGLSDAADRGEAPGATFHFEIAGDLLDDDTIQVVRASRPGLFQFEIGLQSMQEDTLRAVRRTTDMALLRAGVRALIATGKAHVHLDLIAGLPGEDLCSFARGLDEAYRLGSHALQLGFLKLLHGSAMRENPDEYPCRYSPHPPYTVLSTPWLSEEDISRLRVVETGLNKVHNSGRFGATLRWLTGGSMAQSPFSLFETLGAAIRQAQGTRSGLPLDELTDCVYYTLQGLYPLHIRRLQDLMLIDRLATVKTHVLPKALRTQQPRLYDVAKRLEKLYPRLPGQLRAMALLQGGRAAQIIFCDYGCPNPVTGRYSLVARPLSAIMPTGYVKNRSL